MMTNQVIELADNETLVGAHYGSGNYPILTYDDGFGPLWISRNSIGINGIVRAKTWEDAYGICEDEFFPEADETVEELVKAYGSIPEADRPSYLGAYEKDPTPEAVLENELFQEAYGFRNNGPNSRDKLNHGIYQKDLNGDSLDPLTADMLEDLRIELVITTDTDQE